MDTPEGFDDWSDECKQRFRDLKAEWDAREVAEQAAQDANEAAEAAQAAVDALQEAQDAADAECDAIDEWLASYSDLRREAREARNQKKREKDSRIRRRRRELRALRTDLRRRVDAGEMTEDEARQEYQEVRDAHDEEVDRLTEEYEALREAYNELARERNRKRDRKRDIERESRERADEIEEAEGRRDEAARADEAAQAALGQLRSEKELMEDYWRMVRECGPQDPAPGEPSVPVPLGRIIDEGAGEQGTTDEDSGISDWQDRLWAYTLGLPPQTEQTREAIYVGMYPDELILEPSRPQEQQIQDYVPTIEDQVIKIADNGGRNWHQGCVEFIWVQGTDTAVDPHTTSNPITQTIAKAMNDVNGIYAECCVRFSAFVKVVTLVQLGDLSSATTGITNDNGTTKAVEMDAFDRQSPRKIAALQDQSECVGFLVVDEVAGGAGFATTPGKSGVVTMHQNIHQHLGDTTAHELGHAVGGITHTEGEGADRTEHAHGELMWGEGSAGYPNREQRRYAKVTDDDCAKMYANTADTGELCEGDGEGAVH